MRHAVLLSTNIIIIMMNVDYVKNINKSNRCFDQEDSPLCICRSALTDFFLAKLSLSRCDNSFPTRRCRQGRFQPPSFHLTQLLPKLANLSHCLQDTHCLHTLHSPQHCRRCQLSPSLFAHNDSSLTDACFHICEHDTSCGFLCLNRHIIISISCKICRERKQSISCR
jgi:hypothetical protein